MIFNFKIKLAWCTPFQYFYIISFIFTFRHRLIGQVWNRQQFGF